MTVALKLVPVESSLCVWCLGLNGQHDPKCYVGRAIARQLAKAHVVVQTHVDGTVSIVLPDGT